MVYIVNPNNGSLRPLVLSQVSENLMLQLAWQAEVHEQKDEELHQKVPAELPLWPWGNWGEQESPKAP